MSEFREDEDGLTFGENLLGMQGFNASRAEKYRKEINSLLMHRLSRFERWTCAINGILFTAIALTGAIGMARSHEHQAFAGFEEVRTTLAIILAATGVSLGSWTLWIGFKGGYARRTGDIVGLLIATLCCSGVAAAFMEIAWATELPDLRLKMFSASALFFAGAGGCLVVALMQRMHRQTYEKLLRIEYHVAELMERGSGAR